VKKEDIKILNFCQKKTSSLIFCKKDMIKKVFLNNVISRERKSFYRRKIRCKSIECHYHILGTYVIVSCFCIFI